MGKKIISVKISPGQHRKINDLRSGATASISDGFWSTGPSVFPKTTLPHLNSRFTPRSHNTSTELVSSMTRISDTSNTPALTRILILAMLGSASSSLRILSCLLAFF